MLHCNQEPAYFFKPIVNSAVPCFFMISGFFIYSEDKRHQMNKIKRGIYRISIILAWSTLICSLDDIYRFFFYNEWSISFFDLFVKFLIFNENPFAFHLWYISAYLYVLLFFYSVNKSSLKISHNCFLLLFFIGFVIMGFFQFCHLDEICCYRNFLFQGIPFFYLGMIIKKNIYITTRLSTTTILFCIVIVEIVALLFEKTIYLSSSLIAFLSLLLFVNINYKKQNLFSKIGEEDGLYIYIFHPIAMIVYKYLYVNNLMSYNPYVFSALVFVTTIILIRITRLVFIRISYIR